MAHAVARAFDSGQHLLVQAGTGTGKSLAYLVPAALRALSGDGPVVVSTATLALQAQLVERDLPQLAVVLQQTQGLRPLTWATVKGRANYACLHRVHAGVPDDDGALVPLGEVSGEVSGGPLGRAVLRLRRWVERQEAEGGPGDRDHLEPVDDRAWQQVSVGARECLGAQACPFGAACFAERARARAEHADIVVTNHALLAYHWIEGVRVLPDHDVLVVDEAHELVARIAGVATAELASGAVTRAARRSRRGVEEDVVDRLHSAAEALDVALADAPSGRLHPLPEPVATAVGAVRDAGRAVLSGLRAQARADGADPDREAVQRSVRTAVEDVVSVAARISEQRDGDVVWAEQRARGGPVLRVAPLSVAGLVRSRMLSSSTAVLTSATLTLGGAFDAVAGSLGLTGEDAPAWEGLDVGSPFDFRRTAMLYVATHLPPPGRQGVHDALLAELTALVDASAGGALGLFSSRAAAVAAAAEVRERLPGLRVLCQGEDTIASLVRQFRDDPAASLFGTLSLWQGVDVPGPSCRLVVIDRIPFPRPDDPLMSARARDVDRRGGNGFLQVSAAHAALLLAQGAGRLIRAAEDRGVVAVLDPRLATARYAGYLRASLPPMWFTADRAVVLAALGRLAVAHVKTCDVTTAAEPP